MHAGCCQSNHLVTVDHIMPPKKAKPADIAAPASVLIARCSRSALEALVLEAIQGNPITSNHLTRLLPHNKCIMTLAPPTVAGGQSRMGTGWFDLLDDELLVTIVSQVHSTEIRLTCAISVCKAWRNVLQCQEVFSKIAMVAAGFLYGGITVTSSNAARLFKWLPDAAGVTSLEITTGNKKECIGPDVIKKALPLMKNLKVLRLSGKKITSAVLATAAKQPFSANLREFALRDSAGVQSNELLPLLGQSCRLHALTLESLDEPFARSLAHSWAVQRGGGAIPLLSKLEVMKDAEWATFRALPSRSSQSSRS